MAGWQQIGETDVKQHNEDSWQIKFYFYSSSSYTVKTVPLMSEIKLKKGKPNAGKFDFIKISQADFQIIDKDNWLSDMFEENNDDYFQAKIYKNSSLYFVGNIYINKSIHDPNVSKSTIGIKVYDGLARLKEFTTLSDFGSGKVSVSEIMRTCFNALDFGINIQLYENISIGTASTSISSFNTLFVEMNQFLSLSSNLTFYGILLNFAETFGITIYQENGLWVLRENNAIRTGASYKVGKFLINYSTGAVTTSGTVDLTTNFAESELGRRRLSYKFPKINENNFKVSYVDMPKGFLDWDNSSFKEGSNGWSASSGSGSFINEALVLENGEEYYQDSGDIDADEEIVVEMSVACSRMVLDATEILTESQNPLYAIAYIAGGTTYYWNFLSDTWSTTIDKFGLPLAGVETYDSDTATDIFDTQYTTKESAVTYNLTVPSASGNIRIILYGGGTASGNNYPLEFGAQHNRCSVKRKETGANTDVQAKSIIVQTVASTFKGEVEQSLTKSVLLHDLDAFLQTSYWKSVYDEFGTPTITYEQTNDDWANSFLSSQMLLELVSKSNIAFNRSNGAIDMRLLPGNDKSFTALLYGSFGNLANTYYLPVYEERELVSGTQRIIAHEHIYTAVTLINNMSYSY